MKDEWKREEIMHTFRSSLLAVRLHGDVGIKMVQSSVSLLTAIPATLVHALNFFIASAGSLVLLGTGNWDERVDLGQVMLLTISNSQRGYHTSRRSWVETR